MVSDALCDQTLGLCVTVAHCHCHKHQKHIAQEIECLSGMYQVMVHVMGQIHSKTHSMGRYGCWA